MSYSRWGANSCWYTFYACSYSIERDDQIFEICAVKSFSYGELKKDLEGCLKLIKEKCPEATPEEIDELKGYMEEFLVDVESDIALNLVQEIKNSELKKLPDLYQRLKEQVYKCYNADEYGELLEDIEKILYKAGTKKSEYKTPIGQQLFERKKLIPKKTRFEILKS